jgi:hypothetical protein
LAAAGAATLRAAGLALLCGHAASWSAGSSLGHAEAVALARENAPAVQMQQAALAGASAARIAADSKPDPRLMRISDQRDRPFRKRDRRIRKRDRSFR